MDLNKKAGCCHRYLLKYLPKKKGQVKYLKVDFYVKETKDIVGMMSSFSCRVADSIESDIDKAGPP